MTAKIVCAAIALSFAAGSANAAEPAKTSTATGSKAAAPQQPAVEHTYVVANKRDPFKDQSVVLPPPDEIECGGLCQYDVEQFKLAALATGINVPIGGVLAPNGTVYIVDKNTRIGKRNGRVVEITAKGIVVQEQCAKESGKMCKTAIVMAPEDQKAKDEDLTRKK